MLREQVITPRGGRAAPGSARKGGRSGGAGGSGAQRPVQRGNTVGRYGVSRARRLTAYLPLVAKLSFALCAILFIVTAYRAAASAAFFEMRTIDVSGAERASVRDIEATVRRISGSSGVWKADINRISAELERLPWVRTAIITRVLPGTLRIRISERVPRAVVRLSQTGRLAWADADGYLLGGVSPNDQMPPFFVRGWNETGGDAARRENRERIERYARMARDWEAAGVVNRISEVNLEDLRDVRAQLAGADSNIEVRLGGEDFGNRLQRALRVLDDERHTPRGALITRLDATVERRVIVGFSSSAITTSAPGGGNEDRSIRSGSNNRGLTNRTQAREGEREAQRNAASNNRRTSEEASGRRERRREREVAPPNRSRINEARRTPASAERPRRIG